MPFIAKLWFLQAVATFAFVAPIAFLGRSRAAWRVWELLAFVVPFSIWLLLMFYGKMPKSLSNIGEVINVPIAIVVAAVVRVGLGSRFPRTAVAVTLQFLLCAVAACTYFLTPLLPE